MTINEMTICNLIQSFPVLLILAQNHNRCLETQFVYKPPSPTQSPEYYLALEALFQNLYGHGYPSPEAHKPCYTYSKKYGIKPCHGSHGYPEHGYGSYGYGYGSHNPSYGSHGPDYGHSYGSPGYSGAGYGALGSPGYKKGNMYTDNVTYGGGYALNQGYSSTSNRYKVVVKKTRIGRTRKKSGKLREGAANACTAVNGGPGKCISLEACKPYKEAALARGGVSSPITTWMLRKAHCGFQGNNIMVCCPVEETKELEENLLVVPITTTSTKLPPSTTVSSTVNYDLRSLPPSTTTTGPYTVNYDLLALFGETCRTVYNTTGSCKDLYLCQPMMEVAKRAGASLADARLLKEAHCGFRGSIPKVCCPLPFQPTDLPTTTTTEATTTTTSSPTAVPRRGGDFLTALPEAPTCGVSNVAPRDRVVAGIPAKLGAFPWMALLGYKDLSIATGVRWRCGGSLVSVRHVLTAAHCIHRQEDDLFLVRLGELDLDREDEGATPVDILIKEMIKHEQYTKNEHFAHDVGILVLESDVVFTDLIKPICLPSKQWLTNTFEDFSPFVAGWGNLKYGGIAASHLQVAQVPVISNADCERAYSAYLTNKSRVHFSTRTLCAGYMQGGIDSCDGDSGGPLMQTLHGGNYETYFYVIGVVSVGRKCAVANAPGVYARVTHYMPWIQGKLLGTNS